ncbi:MAG: aldehyde dehydrogenase family protein, partial [Hyphomicrobiaceae bacterium]
MTATPAAVRTETPQSAPDVDTLIANGRNAMEALRGVGQARIDEAVTALAWSIYKPENAQSLAELAVETTGLGDIDSKITKNTRKTFGTLRDLMRVKSTGIIEELPEKGLVKYAKPVGVVAAITPSTNPSATPVNKAMMALKGGNAVVIAPSPSAWIATNATVEGMRAELEKIGLPADLVQILPAPVTKEATQEVMEKSDLIVCTGSQNNVKRAYSAGRPAIGVGAGNVPVIIDATADLDDAAEKICASKTFDHATSCSSENCLVIVDAVYDGAIAALERAGGYMAADDARDRVIDRLWQDGKLNRHVIARPTEALIDVFDLPDAAKGCKFV